MVNWSDTRFRELSGARVPIIQAPMAGAGGVDLAVGAIQAGAVGSLPCALLTPEQVHAQASEVRARASGPLNLNFFCHDMPAEPDDRAWRAALAPFYAEFGIDDQGESTPLRRPFDAAMAEAVEAIRPELVSFHFGLPGGALLARVQASGAKVIGNATTASEAAFLAVTGCDAIIAQGFEAGGHAGYFLDGHRPVGLLTLLRQCDLVVAAPVIAAGGIADGEGFAAAMMAGASAVQIGTAYLNGPESLISARHRELMHSGESTVFTNVFSGRPARGFRNRLVNELGPMSDVAPPFPYAATALAPLRARAPDDFSPFWAGQNASMASDLRASELTSRLAAEALALLEGAA
ncbi:MAG: nitronate monooxygenase family protein [Pseudomonadota bacterium]